MIRVKLGRWKAIVASLCALGLAGCATLPESSPVSVGSVDFEETGKLVFVAYGPDADASPEQILRGFIAALAAGVDDRFETARSFLTAELAAEWQPGTGTVVYNGDITLETAKARKGSDQLLEPSPTRTPARKPVPQPAPDLSKEKEVTLIAHMRLAANVDEGGRFTEAPTNASHDASFTLTKDSAGQWRISKANNGLVISQPLFTSAYRATPIYFATRDGELLVPDVRWFPQANASTHAVEALLAGPSLWLRDSVMSGAPAGTMLRISSIAPDPDGVVTVDVTSPMNAASQRERGIFAAQLEATLRMPGIGAISLAVNGAPVGYLADPTIERDPVPGDPVAQRLLDGAIVRFNGRNAEPVGEFNVLRNREVTALTTMPNQPGRLFARLKRSSIVTVGPRGLTTVLAGKNLIAPSVDRFGWVWSASKSVRNSFLIGTSSGSRIAPLTTPWLEKNTVVALAVSRDGTRLAVLTDSPEGRQLDVAAIVRDSEGRPQRVGSPISVAGGATGLSDVAWVDEETVALLAGFENPGLPNAYVAMVGGPSEALPAVEAAVAITAGRGRRSISLETANADIYGRGLTGSNWTVLASGFRAFNYPG